MLRVNTFIVTVFVSLHFHTLLSSLHSSFSSLSFIHHFHHVHSPWESVLFSYFVSCIQRYSHIRSPPSALHTSTLSLPLIIISSVHFYCHLHSHWTCPYGHGKGSYGHGLAHTLPVPALCGHGKGVSVCCFVNEGINGKPLLFSLRHTEHFVVCVYFPTHFYQTADLVSEQVRYGHLWIR